MLDDMAVVVMAVPVLTVVMMIIIMVVRHLQLFTTMLYLIDMTASVIISRRDRLYCLLLMRLKDSVRPVRAICKLFWSNSEFSS